MFDTTLSAVVEFLNLNMVDPFFATLREYAAGSWAQYTTNAKLLAATGIVVGAMLTSTGARLLMFSAVLLLATPDLVVFAGKAGDAAAHLTKVLYVVGVLAGALGLLEGGLKLVFGKEAGAFAFATVVGTVIGGMIPFVARRR
ncbi:MAG TPA: hypothetical protein VFC54_14605 [Pseudolabrys sp.]|nr:hypothetical protein [Pseudolabrys sp.]